MKLPDNDLPADPAATARLLRVHMGAEAPPERTGPLDIRYTTTRVHEDGRVQLLRVPGLVTAERTPLADSFKMLRSQVLQRMRAEGQRLIAVTSPRPMLAKTTTALNLALTLAADLDTSVLAIDADLQSRALQRLFGLDACPGLAEHLTKGLPLGGLLVNPGIERLVLLPAGAAPAALSAELLATRAMRALAQEIKQRYADRIVVIDLPPLLDTADALAFLPLADTTLVVLEEGSTRIADIEAANELLAPFPLIGTVLSPPPPRPPRRWWPRWTRRA